MRVVTHVCIGFPKSGTTWLTGVLNRQPGCSAVKDIDSLTTDRSDRWVARHFDASAVQRIDVSHDGIFFDETLEALRRSPIPTIVMMRDPVRRTISDYLYRRKQGRIPPSMTLERAVEVYPEIVARSQYERWIVPLAESDIPLTLCMIEWATHQLPVLEGALSGWLGRDVLVSSSEANTRVKVASDARNSTVNAVVHGAARAIRAAGLGRLVDRVKGSSVVASALYRQAETDGVITDQGATYLAQYFTPTYQFLKGRRVVW